MEKFGKENIAVWKMNQIAEENCGGFCEEVRGIERETERAVLVRMVWGYTSSLRKIIKVWIPKSCIMSADAVKAQDAERQAKAKAWEEERQARFEAGKKRYEALIAFAKENGVKGVRVGLRADTIIRKIKEAGIECNSFEFA